MTESPPLHQHDWRKIEESKTATRTIIIYECKICKTGKIDTSQLLDPVALLNEVRLRDTQSLPVGDFENDRLVLKAFLEVTSRDPKKHRLVATLQDVTDRYNEQLKRADQPVPKHGSMRVVSDRMARLGFGAIDPASYDLAYQYEYDVETFALDPVEAYQERKRLLPARQHLRALLVRFNIHKDGALDALVAIDDDKWIDDTFSGAIAFLLRTAMSKRHDRSRIHESDLETMLTDTLHVDRAVAPIEIEKRVSSGILVRRGTCITTEDEADFLAGKVDVKGTRRIDSNKIKLLLSSKLYKSDP